MERTTQRATLTMLFCATLAACGGGGSDQVATQTVCRPESDSTIVTPRCWTEPVKPPTTAGSAIDGNAPAASSGNNGAPLNYPIR